MKELKTKSVCDELRATSYKYHLGKALVTRCSSLIATLAMMGMLAIGCDTEYTTYDGENYIMFSDTLYVFPVQEAKDSFEVPISATRTCDYDRTFAVEVREKETSAIEKKHYAVADHTVTIKAGELTTSVKLYGYQENITLDESDNLEIALRLVTKEETQWDLYGTDTRVVLHKTCPFDINRFTGYCLVSSSYIYDYMYSTAPRLTQSELDPEEENTIIMKDYFYDGYDVKIKFTTDDVLNPLLKMEEQVFASTVDAFGTIYGDGDIMMVQPAAYTSYYSSCEHFILQYMTLYVPNVGTVGTYVNAVEWISDDEAEKLKREGL